MLHLVLYQPEIPQNAGNIARTAAAIGFPLHLIRPLGFRLGDPRLKRAGLDYWPHVDLRVWDTWEAFLEALPPGARVWAFSARGTKELYEASFRPGDYLLFGPETRGLPPEILLRFPSLRIPMPGPVRSLNLAVAVGVAAYEAYRQVR
ncbi:MAG: tRNA (cytidine(34)-2'-O)-methyltransferase [Thermus sp.]|uniref:tRNA (cytidine(34)-2'-O)-methyltransferase n=1 Tax=unclassified Thermus TaxID=2619321 RepID=UPI000238938D|nr:MULTISPECIES: tRNA (cytidine(34)-2'-O)-methyltransferase [unclassified Thermus]AEV17249.1 tRNA/rRNA methyltransferase [Thermus sp. CCB_US3_UF1]MCS7217503.1 tRNA (cytidine(34)-2'-O)-methyltransferase [Thermus sp.]MCX7848848.1 tRNA (cytidine(34)-2'-O)-methyltransferase [Thermus sp.]MDW8016741.1 tRNA (cytidine(34)-2'-O)-methyltransferase [Thermus sp.]MDW8357443.1 tRNA (cytidine(34)-2'-O)-methyltransferase [Thermus sp.]